MPGALDLVSCQSGIQQWLQTTGPVSIYMDASHAFCSSNPYGLHPSPNSNPHSNPHSNPPHPNPPHPNPDSNLIPNPNHNPNLNIPQS